jgi:hypothetical protein
VSEKELAGDIVPVFGRFRTNSIVRRTGRDRPPCILTNPNHRHIRRQRALSLLPEAAQQFNTIGTVVVAALAASALECALSPLI